MSFPPPNYFPGSSGGGDYNYYNPEYVTVYPSSSFNYPQQFPANPSLLPTFPYPNTSTSLQNTDLSVPPPSIPKTYVPEYPYTVPPPSSNLCTEGNRERDHAFEGKSRTKNEERDREYRSERSHHKRENSRTRSCRRSSSRHRTSSYRRTRSRSRNINHHRSRSRSKNRDRHSEHRSSRHSSYKRDSPRSSRYRSPIQRSSSSRSQISSRPRSRDRHRGREYSISSHRSSRSRSKIDVTAEEKTDRELILDEYRRNYCNTSEELVEKLKKWAEGYNEEENDKIWYRSSPAELYYKQLDNKLIEGTSKLKLICDKFMKELIERGRNARPLVDEHPPLKPQKPKLCHHHSDKSHSSSSAESDLSDAEDGASDRVMQELERKQTHPRRLHPELWHNDPGEMNSGPLCRCSMKARKHGVAHGIYSGEPQYPRCQDNSNNFDKLYHYRITVSPPTNFLIKTPTIISHDEHEFLFSGFSMFSHYKLNKLPTCKVIRFNIEYTILYVEEETAPYFTVQELNLFEDYLFTELLELIDLDLGKATDTNCSQFHFMPRFARTLPEGGCEVLSMCEVLKYLMQESKPLIERNMLKTIHRMDSYVWQKFVDRIKGMIVTYPGKKPCSIRVDQIDRSPPDDYDKSKMDSFYPEIVHFGIRPPQLSYAGNPEYKKEWRYYVKYRHLVANMAKPSFKDKEKLQSKEAKLQEMRMHSKMKRDVTVAVSCEGFYASGLMCDVVQHAMLIPVLVRHLRFHKSLETLEKSLEYKFKRRALLQMAFTHPSYRENFGTNPDHARNSLTNCGIRQPEYGDRKIHYMNTRKRGINTLIDIMSRFGCKSESESAIHHNERLEFLGDAVVEFLSSIHLFKMFPGLAEGGLATYRAAIVQNQHLAQLAKKLGLEKYMLYAHGSDLCRDIELRHAMANCFEALIGALFLDGGIEIADKVFSYALWQNELQLFEVWTKERLHPLQEQEPLGDRKYIKDFKFLQKLIKFENSIGIIFRHIRLLARAFTDRSVGFTHLTLGSNQRLEFLGDTVLQLLVSDRLYRHFPDHHEGHLSLLRSSLVNNKTQALVCDDLDMSSYAVYHNSKTELSTKDKADLLEAFLGSLYVDKNLEYCAAFCDVVLFPRLQEFIMNQDWNDPKSKLQQCCLTLRFMGGGEPDIPLYKVIECLGPTNTRVYTVAVYFRGRRLASARGHSIQEAEMNAAKKALANAHDLFPQLDRQKRIIAKCLKVDEKGTSSQKGEKNSRDLYKDAQFDDKVPKSYRLNDEPDDESPSEDERENEIVAADKTDSDSGLDSDVEAPSTSSRPLKLGINSLGQEMEKLRKKLQEESKMSSRENKNKFNDALND